MRIKILLAIAAIVAVTIFGMPSSGGVAATENRTHFPAILNQTLVASGEDSVLARYEHSNRTFEKLRFRNGDVVYYHQRMIGNITVEGDFVNYQVINGTGPLRKNFTHWRDDLPDESPNITITEEEAINITGGGYATLYYISPDSAIFSPVEPVPKEPCWIVWKRDGNNTLYNITVLDVGNGTILGYGIPPPAAPSFVYTGPKNITCTQDGCNCSGMWPDWYESAQHWFTVMGYSPDAIEWPTSQDVRSYIQNYDTALFYGIAHSGMFHTIGAGCGFSYNPMTIHDWIADYPPMRFTFLASCEAMDYSGPGYFEYEFRKGSDSNAVVIGYTGMGQANESAWRDSLAWQNMFFSYMSNGWTVNYAYSQAGEDIPYPFPYIKFAGDENLQLAEPGHVGVPKVYRSSAVAGEVRDVNAKLLHGVSVSLYRYGVGLYDSDVASSDYRIEVDQTGEYWLRASRYTYFTLDTNAMPKLRNPYHPRYINLTTLELLGAGYNLDFEGDYGLVPTTCSMQCAMKSINHWLYTPIDEDKNQHPEWQLSSWKVSQVVHSWLFSG